MNKKEPNLVGNFYKRLATDLLIANTSFMVFRSIASCGPLQLTEGPKTIFLHTIFFNNGLICIDFENLCKKN